MSQYNKKDPDHPAFCRDCYEWISWDKQAMATVQFIGTDGNPYTGTKRPLNLAKTEPHTCPKENGKIKVNEEHKKIVEEAAANKKSSYSGNSSSKQTTLDNTQVLNAINDLNKRFSDYIRDTSKIISDMQEIAKKQEGAIEKFIAYNPTGNSLNALIEMLIKRIPAEDLQPKPATELKKD